MCGIAPAQVSHPYVLVHSQIITKIEMLVNIHPVSLNFKFHEDSLFFAEITLILGFEIALGYSSNRSWSCSFKSSDRWFKTFFFSLSALLSRIVILRFSLAS